MLSIETEARLAKLFLNIADGEKAVEKSRKLLGDQLDFDPSQTFKKLDLESKNYVDEFNIVDFLK